MKRTRSLSGSNDIAKNVYIYCTVGERDFKFRPLHGRNCRNVIGSGRREHHSVQVPVSGARRLT